EGLNKTSGASGRMQRVYGGDFSVYVDYAHTPDGLYNVLSALKISCKKRLICVFGCGGNRDVGKRVEMGKISGELADFTVITSDNPRYEEPMEIIAEIEKGVLEKSKNYVIVQERADGIKYAIEMAKAGDVIVVAGKGSENYQEILGIKRPYNDKDTVEDILRRIRAL
ncbi:MAG: UDP-N-acetylmuramoyl-L-alanyl-D-glutamate--2,6-diaminopimelate ligase, partial [Clostridia bacterium]|nr:UDP-N-acetylmuramoyl-L-alanyl-D-glutamate--2,6-diaminopimelate ligase [Clostridia bacterium]